MGIQAHLYTQSAQRSSRLRSRKRLKAFFNIVSLNDEAEILIA